MRLEITVDFKEPVDAEDQDDVLGDLLSLYSNELDEKRYQGYEISAVWA